MELGIIGDVTRTEQYFGIAELCTQQIGQFDADVFVDIAYRHLIIYHKINTNFYIFSLYVSHIIRIRGTEKYNNV